MNKLITAVMPLLGLGIVLSSCSYQIYPKSTLEFNYDARMTSMSELAAKRDVRIFLSDSEVDGPYETVAFAKYSPFIKIPVIASDRKQQLKKFYKKAVIKAQKLGGNGVVISNVGFFKVIRMNDSCVTGDSRASHVQVQKPAQTQTKPQEINPVQRSAVLDKFDDGTILKVSEKQARKYVDIIRDEIERNTKSCKTLDDVTFVGKKIDALEKYNIGKQKPSSSLRKAVSEYKEELSKVQKKIERKIAKSKK